ncbi:hypothetical protein IHE55_24025 [Streptomyces pactum]|uniref:Uncharacterized protein n=1 Tax=Streptomyces pactum TaxID=68249 RepID=A0ABS0NR60_9ACTN|nr:hypothetical protein [Streptomyces pactum]MBH5337671.1 hypothetical protein [Streptomyces pactum]
MGCGTAWIFIGSLSVESCASTTELCALLGLFAALGGLPARVRVRDGDDMDRPSRP